MVKLRGPALSTHAGGSLGDELIFSNWKGRAYVKKHRAPKQPRTPGQVAMRAMMSFLSGAWTDMLEVNKEKWQDLADHDKISRFNAFQKLNLTRWGHFKAPSKIPTAPEWSPDSSKTPLVLFGLRHAIRVTYSITATNKGWGDNIHQVPGNGQPVHYNDLLHVEPVTAVEDKDFLITGLAAGLHWLAINGFTTTGWRTPDVMYGFATVTD